MSSGNADSQDMIAVLEDIRKQLAEMQKSHRLLSPEHIAQAIGYVQIKNDLSAIKEALSDHYQMKSDLNEIKKSLADLSRHIGSR